MIDYEQVLLNLVKPIVENPDSVSVKKMESINDNEILLYVYAKDSDIARLIGHKGNMAHLIRDSLAIASRKENKRVVVKFEAY